MVSSDPLFINAVEALAGAMGHGVTAASVLPKAASEALVIVDAALPAFERAIDSDPDALMRTGIFAPEAMLTLARGIGGAHVYPRRSLAEELPRLLREYSIG